MAGKRERACLISAWMERSTARMWRAGDQFFYHRSKQRNTRPKGNLTTFQHWGTRKNMSWTLRISRQMRPSLSTFGWYILVRKRTWMTLSWSEEFKNVWKTITFGAHIGYSAGRNSSSLKKPPEAIVIFRHVSGDKKLAEKGTLIWTLHRALDHNLKRMLNL